LEEERAGGTEASEATDLFTHVFGPPTDSLADGGDLTRDRRFILTREYP